MNEIYGFRLYSVIKNLKGVSSVYKIDDIAGFKIYKTEFKDNVYFIFDEEHNVYRSLIYESDSPNVVKQLELYITNYYNHLPDIDKTTLLNDLQ